MKINPRITVPKSGICAPMEANKLNGNLKAFGNESFFDKP